MPYRADLPVPLNEFDTHQTIFNSPRSHDPASLPVANSSRSFWLHPSAEVNPLAKEGSEGPLTSDADICIIGSGITAISAVYHFSRTFVGPLKIVILEARDFCSGATGRNGGHLTPGVSHDFGTHAKSMGKEEALKQFALEHHTVDELLKIIKENHLEDVVDLVSGDHFDLLFTEREVKDAEMDFNLAKEAGARVDNVRWYSTEEMKKTFGTIYPAIKFPGHNLWPLKLVTQLYYLAKKQIGVWPQSSLDLHTNTPVTSIVPSSKASWRWDLNTPRGVVSCGSVLHATNAYASHLLPHMSGPTGIIPVRGQIIATRAKVNSDVFSRSSWSGNEGFEYWFPRPIKLPKDDSSKPLVILGGGREATSDFELYVTDDAVINEDASKALRKFLPAVFPSNYEEGKRPEMEWTGIMGFTSLRDPFVGPVLGPTGEELTGQYISAGYTGHGMPRSYACAEAVVSLIKHDLEGKPRESWDLPRWLPKRYITWNRVGTVMGL